MLSTHMREAPQPVSPDDLNALLAQLQQLPGEAAQGFFGSHSTTWRINRESAVFLGAGRAALLQLAHPWVAAALQQHSSLMHDAIGRFHSTFRVIYTMLFGTRAQALAASRQLYRVHTFIQGELLQSVGAYPVHEHYAANEISALRWVFATLVESAIFAHDFALPALSAAHRESYYRESQRMANLCGIPPQALPSDWAALQQYTASMMQSDNLGVSDEAKRMGQAVLAGVGTWVRAPRWYRALTAEWLSPSLRAGFALPLGPQEQTSLRRAQVWLPRIYRRLPAPLRYVGPYREATARLQGHRPGPFTRASNRFWMGRPRLLFDELA
jgi:uncharacterized protein (DUF2236 family)